MRHLKVQVAFWLSLLVPLTALPQIEEVVVTAQRREQSLQDVPISVSAFTGDFLEQANIRSAVDYLALTPNVSYTEDGQFGKRGAGISIRGVNNLVSGENATVSSVGIYLDEFSVASVPNQFANPQIPDMERIEVLRGPQGTYFGRNSVGGALNLTTRSPTDEFGARIIGGFENYDGAGDMWSITGIANAPLSDQFKVRGVLHYEDNSGTVENVCRSGASASSCPFAADNNFEPNGASDSGHEYIMARIKALWEISDATSVTGTFMYADESQDHDENVPSGVLDLDTVDTLGIEEAIDPFTGFWPQNRNKLSHDRPEKNDLESILAIVNVSHSFSDGLTLKWISGVIDAEFERAFDQDLVGGVDVIGRDNKYEGTSWSTELRLESAQERADWVVGVLYAQDDQEQFNNVNVREGAGLGHTAGGVGFLPPFPTGLGLALNNKNFEVDSIAVFADLTYRVTDQLELIVGGRYTHDEVSDDLFVRGIGPGPDSCPPPVDIVCFFQGFINYPREPVSADEDFDDFSPRVGARYQFNDDVGVYATVSKGYKAGGASLGNDTNAPECPTCPGFVVPYKEEELWNYEVGIKSQLLDDRLRLNASAFFLDWSDLQFESFRFLTPGDIATNFEQTINIEDAEASGVEVEFVAVPTDGLTISGALGYLDTEITSDTTVEITGGFNVDLKGLEIPKSPELTYNLTAEYRWNIGDIEPWVRAEFIHRDGQYSDIEGLTNKQTDGVPSPNQTLVRFVGPGEFPYLSPDYDVLNLRAGFNWNNWDFTVYGQNITDEEYYTGTQENFGASGIRLRPHPLTWGVSIGYRFGDI